MSDKVYEVPAEWTKRAFIDDAKYKRRCTERSLADPDGFWAEQAKRIHWIRHFTKVKNTSFDPHQRLDQMVRGRHDQRRLQLHRPPSARARRPDRHHLGGRRSRRTPRRSPISELHDEVCRFANVLRNRNVEKGDRVTIYLPMIPEAAYAMLACARIGAIHSVVFGGFSPDSLAGRIEDCKSNVVITADEGLRGGRKVPLKANADAAIAKMPAASTTSSWCKRTGAPVDMAAGPRRLVSRGRRHGDRRNARCAEMNAEDPLFILYTSGSTGKPKGVLHTTGGYLVYTSMTHQYVFDYHDGDIYWCTADVGWVTGHSYIVYGPLANGATTLMFEGVPNYPTMSRFWEVIDKHKVNIFYTAPTAIRALMQAGDEPVKKTSRASLAAARLGRRADQSGSLGMVSPRGRRRPLPDRRHLVADRDRRHSDHAAARRDARSSPARRRGRSSASCRRSSMPRARCSKARRPAISASPIPGRARCARVYGDHQRFVDTYFTAYPGKYFTGDGCRRDEDGYYWITGRVDDVINVAGHRLGTAEVESALVAHPKVSRGRGGRLSARHQGPGHLCLCHADGRRAADRGAAQGAGALGAHGNRPDRLARPDPVRARPAEDPLRQDHAPHPAQDRRGRVRQSRRHLDARRSRRGRRPGRQPAEQEKRVARSQFRLRAREVNRCGEATGPPGGRR